MITAKISEGVHSGGSFTIRCSKCTLCVFSGQSKDIERAERVIRSKFNELHIGCDAIEMNEDDLRSLLQDQEKVS